MKAAPAAKPAASAQLSGAPRSGRSVGAVAPAISTAAETPSAVPSCAAVFRMPAAAPRCSSGTSVPTVLAATEDRPIPSPDSPAQTGSRMSIPGSSRAPSPAAIRPSPIAMVSAGSRVPNHRPTAPAPSTTHALNGRSIKPVAAGLTCRVSWR